MRLIAALSSDAACMSSVARSRGIVRTAAAFLLIVVATGVLKAQVTASPQNVQDLLSRVGPVWGDDIAGNIRSTLEVYTPVLKDAPKGNVQATMEVAYGPEAEQYLDLYRQDGLSGAPIVVFLHGGAYVRGARNTTPETYSNVSIFFARMGMLGVNADYRLAPAAPWPAGAEDVGAIVQWLKSNGSRYGGDPDRIYLIGHSAGATHVANYAYDESLQPESGPGIAGMILMSGRYNVMPNFSDPNFDNVRAYFGDDATLYPQRSPINHIQDADRIPTFLVIAEYDNPSLDVVGAELFSALCVRDGACPRFTRLSGHNHLSMVYHFNTADEALGREIINFIDEGR